MKIDWLNVDVACRDLPEVTSSKIFAKKGLHPDGLFSERIFGPTKNYTCGCGIYHGRSKYGTVCATCGVKIENSNARRKNMAKITLPFPVINPIMLYTIKRVKLEIYNVIMSMIMDNDVFGYYYDEDKKKYVKIEKPEQEGETPVIPDGVRVYSGPNSTYDVVADEAQRQMEKSRYWKFIYDRLQNFWMKTVGVVPPEFRPVSKSNNQQMRDEMNKYYLKILEFNVINKDNQLNLTDQNTETIFRFNFKNLQTHILDLYQFIFDKFSKKTGLIRGSILGKRIDFSGRCVIDPDPSLELDQCGIPYLMALEFFKLQVANRLLELRNFNGTTFCRYDPALKFVDKCIDDHDFCLFDIVSKIANNRLIMLNRQPTLHRMGLMSFRCVVHKDFVIKTHPFICEPYNADYDGDQMAAYVSLYPETEQSNKDHLYIMKNIISPSTGDVCLSVNQDVVLGLYLLTKDDASPAAVYDGPKPCYGSKEKPIHTTEGRIEFNSILPDSFPYFNETLTKGKIHVILNVIGKNYDSDTVKLVLDRIKTLGFGKTTQIGSTFSMKNLDVNPETVKHISDIVDDKNKSLAEKFFALAESPLKKEVESTFPYADFIKSGSRGTWDQADQLIWCRGYVSNSKGQVVETPIKHNLVSGMTKDEFFTSCFGARKALLDVALNTAVSGYLTRKLVYANVNVELDEQCDDCGTDQYMELTIPEEMTDAKIEELTSGIEDPKERQLKVDELKIQRENSINPVKLARSLRYRWYLNEETGQLEQIGENDFRKVIGKTIKLRSPIFCKNPRICKRCYGDLHKILHSKYIGVIAAQSLGEVATQLTLRTFHVSGVAQMSKGQQDDTQQDIINDLTNVRKILHGGDEWNTTGYKDMITNLFHIYSNHKTLMLVHFELAVSQLMRHGSQRWRLVHDRDNYEPQIVSIDKVPSLESFLLALAFSKPYVYIIGGIMGNAQPTDGILEKMLINRV